MQRREPEPCRASSTAFLALPAVDDGPRGIGELHRCVRREGALTASFPGSDGTRDAALAREPALRERLRESMEFARATRPRGLILSSPDEGCKELRPTEAIVYHAANTQAGETVS